MATFTIPARAVDAPVPELQGVTTQSSSSGASAGSSAPPADTGSDQANTPDSTEQGVVDLSQSFEHRPLEELLQESRLVGLRDTTFNVLLRSYYLESDNIDHSESEAWALGGWAGLKTGYFLNFAALGATEYTSQRLYGPADQDGTKLLQTGQRSYTVLGELYGQFRLTDQITAIAGRRAFDTPFINEYDSRMTPNTFELYALQGAIGSTDTRTLRFGAGYVDSIKDRNSEQFISMAAAAGAPTGVNRGVYVAGATYRASSLSIGAVDYYSSDIINIAYADLKYAVPLSNLFGVRFAAQYADQHSTGDDLLTGHAFSAHQYGLKAELVVGSALFTTARTLTARGTTNASGSGTDMLSPWGSYPGFTKVQVEDFDRAGENATLLRAAYSFPLKTGLSMYALWVHGSTPEVVNQYAQQEYDFNVQWTASSGALRGLALRARYAHVAQAGPSDQHDNELRLILNYPLR